MLIFPDLDTSSASFSYQLFPNSNNLTIENSFHENEPISTFSVNDFSSSSCKSKNENEEVFSPNY